MSRPFAANGLTGIIGVTAMVQIAKLKLLSLCKVETAKPCEVRNVLRATAPGAKKKSKKKKLRDGKR
jgi:hypothetical protein